MSGGGFLFVVSTSLFFVIFFLRIFFLVNFLPSLVEGGGDGWIHGVLFFFGEMGLGIVDKRYTQRERHTQQSI